MGPVKQAQLTWRRAVSMNGSLNWRVPVLTNIDHEIEVLSAFDFTPIVKRNHCDALMYVRHQPSAVSY
jgi:hypothetical protein